MSTGNDLHLRRRVAEEAACNAGAVQLRYRGGRLRRNVHNSNPADYTTEVDLAAQEIVKQTIWQYFPGERVIGEEDLQLRRSLPNLLQSSCWLTDPLDGTQEFAHGNPGFSCVVGYVINSRPLVGAVYFPAWEELFSAVAGLGATLNGAVISVSPVQKLEHALLAVPQSNSSTAERVAKFVEQISKVLPHVEGLRIPGARSYMACGVAAGRYDIASTFDLGRERSPDGPFRCQPWETAAFAVLVQEAGGAIRGRGGGPPDLLDYNVYGACESLLDDYLELMG
jgi:myo-inositol-1(or 4)-monophosphatase